jgi:hypothetical protein
MDPGECLMSCFAGVGSLRFDDPCAAVGSRTRQPIEPVASLSGSEARVPGFTVRGPGRQGCFAVYRESARAGSRMGARVGSLS